MKNEAAARVLLVDDHPDTLSALSRLLRLDGYSVTTATGIAAARVICAAQAFDVLVADLQLADGEGTDLADLVACGTIGRAIALTGHGDDDHRAAAAAAGFDAYLLKPVAVKDLSATLRRLNPPSPPSQSPIR